MCSYVPDVPDPSEHVHADRRLGLAEAEALAEAMRAFGTASRLRLLFELLSAERTVAELAVAVGMESSAVSQQLRVLRQLRLVTATRRGHRVGYRLYDDHVAALLLAIRHHHKHAQGPASLRTGGAPEPSARSGAGGGA